MFAFEGDVIVNRRDPVNTPHLVLELEEAQVSAFFWFLQNGFVVTNVEVGCSVMSFLNTYLGISSDYIRDRISTIFLDGKPVDDPDSAVVLNGSRLALSSALPGLVGATMRRGGALASLRSSITYRETGICIHGKGIVYVKLFNMVMEDAGPDLLRKGIFVSGLDLEAFLQQNSPILGGCRHICFNKKSIDCRRIAGQKLFADLELVRVSVISEQSKQVS